MGTRADAIDAAVALSATETVEKSLGSLTIPQSVERITGVWCYVFGGAGGTTLENISGVWRLTSKTFSFLPFTLPLDIMFLVGTGLAIAGVRVWPVEIPTPGVGDIQALAVLDLAQTVNNTARWGYLGEGPD